MLAAPDEMRRVLGDTVAETLKSNDGGVELFRWRHDALHGATQAMQQHVLLAYRDTPRAIRRRLGRRTSTSVTDNDSVTIIPIGLKANWDIEGELDVVHVYVGADRLEAVAARAELQSDFVARDAVAAHDPGLSHLIRLLNSVGTRQDPSCLDRLYADTLAEAVCLHLLQAWSSSGDLDARDQRYIVPPARLGRAIDYMRANMSDPPNLAAIAEEAGLSPKHFCTAFRRQMGLPPHAWLRQERMAEARRRLLDPDCTIAQLAGDLSYADQSAFGAAFKQYTGSSPAEWRRRAVT